MIIPSKCHRRFGVVICVLLSSWSSLGCTSEPDRASAAKLIAQRDWPIVAETIKYAALIPSKRVMLSDGTNDAFLNELVQMGYLRLHEREHIPTISRASHGTTVYGCDPATAYPGRTHCGPHKYLYWERLAKLQPYLINESDYAPAGQLRLVMCRSRLGEITGMSKLSESMYRIEYSQIWEATEVGRVFERHSSLRCETRNAERQVATLQRYDDGWRVREASRF